MSNLNLCHLQLQGKTPPTGARILKSEMSIELTGTSEETNTKLLLNGLLKPQTNKS
jgi:hypothetical protein